MGLLICFKLHYLKLDNLFPSYMALTLKKSWKIRGNQHEEFEEGILSWESPQQPSKLKWQVHEQLKLQKTAAM